MDFRITVLPQLSLVWVMSLGRTFCGILWSNQHYHIIFITMWNVSNGSKSTVVINMIYHHVFWLFPMPPPVLVRKDIHKVPSKLRRALLGNRLVDHSDVIRALLELHLHAWLNTWLQWIGQRQLHDETRIIRDLVCLILKALRYIMTIRLWCWWMAVCHATSGFAIYHSELYGLLWCLTHWSRNKIVVDDTLKCIFVREYIWISLEIPLKFVPKVPINSISALVHIMAWRRIYASLSHNGLR